MRKFYWLVMAAVLGLGLVVQAQPMPLKVFVSPGPGIKVPFSNNEFPVDNYGIHVAGYGWSWDTWSGSCSAGALERYRPTLDTDPNNWVAMPTDQDWLFTITYHHTGDYWPEAPWYLKNEQDDLGIAKLACNGTTNDWSFFVADASNVMQPVAGAEHFSIDDWTDFAIHYKAASETLDFWIDESGSDPCRVAQDVVVGPGRYDVDYVQLEWLRAGTDHARNINVSQADTGAPPVCGDLWHVPPPGDLDGDCWVRLSDLAILSNHWLTCTAPECVE